MEEELFIVIYHSLHTAAHFPPFWPRALCSLLQKFSAKSVECDSVAGFGEASKERTTAGFPPGWMAADYGWICWCMSAAAGNEDDASSAAA